MIKTLRKLKAKIYRTFVTDCPVCHKHFYGFHAYAVHMKVNNKHYRIVCHVCAEKHSPTKHAKA